MHSRRLKVGSIFQQPMYRYDENLLGFETDLIFFEGIPASNVVYHKVPNTRRETPYIRRLIESRWQEIVKRNPWAYDSPRARYEGATFDNDTRTLQIFWSEERYSTHAVMRETIFPRSYQANLFTINGILLTRDGYIPIAVRNPRRTDQGRILHITPAGFIDLKKVGTRFVPERVDEATLRKLLDELNFIGVHIMESPYDATLREMKEELKRKKPEGEIPFDPNKMSIIAIIYNSRKNFDYTAAVLIPVNLSHEEITLRGEEHEELKWVRTSLDSLKTTLFELAIAPETNSGHLRGDIACLIGYLYGVEEYKKTLEEIVMEINFYESK